MLQSLMERKHKQRSVNGTLAIVTTTVGGEADAGRLARQIVDERLAACVQSSPIRSVYRWQGAVEDSPEIQLRMKTPVDRVDALVTWLTAHHPYEVPEMLIESVERVSDSYWKWAVAETRAEKGRG